MRATGIVRRIDDLGRVVIPKEIRRKLKIREGDPLELFMANDSVTFKKYSYMGDFQDCIERCCKALTSMGVSNAWYDRDYKICGNNNFPDKSPEDSEGSNYMIHHEYFEANDFSYFPIMSNGDLFGYVAVNLIDAVNKKEMIETVVRIVSNFVEF